MKSLAFYAIVGITALLACNTSVLADLQLVLDAKGLSYQEQQASRQLFKEAEAALPPLFKQQLNRIVRISWVTDLPKDVYGLTTNKDALVLNKLLLPSLTDGSAATKKTKRFHGTLRKELLATVLHELTHVYDGEGFFSAKEQARISYCQRLVKTQGLSTLPLYCADYKDRHFTMSDGIQGF